MKKMGMVCAKKQHLMHGCGESLDSIELGAWVVRMAAILDDGATCSYRGYGFVAWSLATKERLVK